MKMVIFQHNQAVQIHNTLLVETVKKGGIEFINENNIS